MGRFIKFVCLTLGATLSLQIALFTHLWAFTITEVKSFNEGPYNFKLEIQVYGRGSFQKGTAKLSSLKIKIRNERSSSEALNVKAIRVYSDPQVYRDLDTIGYAISPGKWVTKYYRLRKEKQIFMSSKGFIAIHFGKFNIQFSPRDHKFKEIHL